jgi:hypothetical protein
MRVLGSTFCSNLLSKKDEDTRQKMEAGIRNDRYQQRRVECWRGEFEIDNSPSA